MQAEKQTLQNIGWLASQREFSGDFILCPLFELYNRDIR